MPVYAPTPEEWPGREQNKTKHFTGCFSATLPKTFSITREGKGEVKEIINKQSSISNPAYVSMTAKISASSLTLCAVLIAALLMHLAVVKGRSCFSGYLTFNKRLPLNTEHATPFSHPKLALTLCWQVKWELSKLTSAVSHIPIWAEINKERNCF